MPHRIGKPDAGVIATSARHSASPLRLLTAFSWQSAMGLAKLTTLYGGARAVQQWRGERHRMREAIGPYMVEERLIEGDTSWVAIRARGAEWSWLTPAEAAHLGQQWVRRYGHVLHREEQSSPGATPLLLAAE
jgi:hypothetical protein